MRADNFKRNNEGYLHEIRVELGSNAGAQSISSMSENRENDEYAERLLEKILDRDNMNRAYRRVKANKMASRLSNQYGKGRTVPNLSEGWRYQSLTGE